MDLLENNLRMLRVCDHYTRRITEFREKIKPRINDLQPNEIHLQEIVNNLEKYIAKVKPQLELNFERARNATTKSELKECTDVFNKIAKDTMQRDLLLDEVENYLIHR